MPGLHELQQDFASAVFDTGKKPPDDVISHAARRPVRRFNIYRNNVASSLTDVLEAYFPVVERLVGNDFFRAMARNFVIATPPTSPILSRYGAEFPAFLATFPPAHDLPYLPDVARLEWLRQRAYHAADAQPLRGDDLAEIAMTELHNMVFRPHPSVGVLASSYPVVSIWRTNTLDDVVATIDADSGAEFALIARPDLTVHVVPLPAGTHTFASALYAGTPLGVAATGAIAADGAFDLQGALATLIEHGAFAGGHMSGRFTSISAEAQS